MKKDIFIKEWSEVNAAVIEGHTCYREPTQIVNNETGESIFYENMEDLYEHAEINGIKFKDIVSEIDDNTSGIFFNIIDDSSIRFDNPKYKGKRYRGLF